MERSTKAAPFHSLSCDQVVHFEPSAIRGTPAHAALFRFHADMQQQTNKPLRMENKTAVQDNQSFSCKMRYCPLAFPDELHETSRAMQSSRRPRMSIRTMCICWLTSGSTASTLRSSRAGWKGPTKRPHFTPSHATKSCILSRPRLGVPLPMQHFFDSMQTCNRKKPSPCAWKTRPPCKTTSPFHVKCAIVH